MANTENWIVLSGSTKQNLTVQNISDLIKSGKIKRTQLVWRNGMNDWIKICEVPEFQSLFADIPPDIPVKNNLIGKILGILPKKSFNRLLFLFVPCLVVAMTISSVSDGVIAVIVSFLILPFFITKFYYQYYSWNCITNKSTARNKVILSVIADILFILTYIFAIMVPAFRFNCELTINCDPHWEERKNTDLIQLIFLGSFLSISIMAILYNEIWAKFENSYNLFKSKLNLVRAPCISKFSNRTWNWIVLFFILFMNIQFSRNATKEGVSWVGILFFPLFWVPYWYKLCKIIDYFKENPLIAQNENIENKNK